MFRPAAKTKSPRRLLPIQFPAARPAVVPYLSVLSVQSVVVRGQRSTSGTHVLLWRERGDDFFKARFATEGIPTWVKAEVAISWTTRNFGDGPQVALFARSVSPTRAQIMAKDVVAHTSVGHDPNIASWAMGSSSIARRPSLNASCFLAKSASICVRLKSRSMSSG